MRRRALRQELRDVFDDLSEPAHPALSARIRDQIAHPAPAPRLPRLAMAVALIAAALVVVSLLFAGRHAISQQTTPAAIPTPTSVPGSPAPTPVPAQPGPTVSVPAAPSPGPGLPAFTCAALSGGGPAMPAPPVGLTAVRAGAQSGYDRFVIELNGPVPQYEVKPQATAMFVQDPSGAPVTLSGSAGLVVVVKGAQRYGTYSGQTDLHPTGTAVMREARLVGDFEGVVTWGLGLSHAACFRVITLTSPSRLVIDVQG